MFLDVELTRLMDRLPPGQMLAVYVQHGSFGFFVQDFTTDRMLLRSALRRAFPRFPPPGVEKLTDLSTLDQLAQILAPLPGRKNVLWFSGGAPRVLVPGDPFNLVQQDPAEARRVDDELEAARIAIYPIDARGLVSVSPNGLPGFGVRARSLEGGGRGDRGRGHGGQQWSGGGCQLHSGDEPELLHADVFASESAVR